MTRQPLTPVLFDRAIRRCLAKAPDERWQTAADLAAERKYVVETQHDKTLLARASTPRRTGSVLAIAAALATVSVLTGVGLVTLWPARSDLPSFNRITFRRGVITAARVAPDGQTIVYSASWEGRPYDLYLTRLGSHEARALELRDARLFSISTSNEMAFMRGRQSVLRAFGTLARVPLAGGEPRELLEHVAAADWSSDGSQLAVVRSAPEATGKVQVEFPIGQKVYESSSNVSSLRQVATVSPSWRARRSRTLSSSIAPGRRSRSLLDGTPRLDSPGRPLATKSGSPGGEERYQRSAPFPWTARNEYWRERLT
jgi:Tol biopolymer transport system component